MGAILNEVQRYHELLSYPQGIVDWEGGKGRVILTGMEHENAAEAFVVVILGGPDWRLEVQKIP